MRQLNQAMECITQADLKRKGVDAVNQGSEEILEEHLLKLFSL